LQIRAGTMPEPLSRRLLHHARRTPRSALLCAATPAACAYIWMYPARLQHGAGGECGLEHRMLVCVNGIAEGLSGKSTPRGEEGCAIPASIKPNTHSTRALPIHFQTLNQEQTPCVTSGSSHHLSWYPNLLNLHLLLESICSPAMVSYAELDRCVLLAGLGHSPIQSSGSRLLICCGTNLWLCFAHLTSHTQPTEICLHSRNPRQRMKDEARQV
jgi:hypothetical protein